MVRVHCCLNTYNSIVKLLVKSIMATILTDTIDIITIIMLYLPAAAAVINTLILRSILQDKQETTVALLEVRNELRNATHRSNQHFKLVKEDIRDLRAEMQDKHEILANILG